MRKSIEESHGAPVGAKPSIWKWLLPAILVITALAFYFFLYHAPRQELHVFKRPLLRPDGTPACFVVLARDGKDFVPLPKKRIDIKAFKTDGTAFENSIFSEEDGTALVTLPSLKDDVQYFSMEASIDGFKVFSPLNHYAPDVKTMIVTDKPVYRPGETVRFMTRSLDDSAFNPSSRSARLELFDAKGYKLYSKELPASEYGISSGEFKLADKVNAGCYTIAAGKEKALFDVMDYQLPQLKLSIETAKPFYSLGGLVEGRLHADYSFSQPAANAKVSLRSTMTQKTAKERQELVNGIFDPFGSKRTKTVKVQEEQSVELAALGGTTDAKGDFNFQFQLPDSTKRAPGKALEFSLTASVETPAGLDEKLERKIKIVSGNAIGIDVSPEPGVFIRGSEAPRKIFVRARYIDGRPATVNGTANSDVHFKTSSDGIALIELPPKSSNVTISASDEHGEKGYISQKLPEGELAIALSNCLVKAGETIQVEIEASFEKGMVYLELERKNQTLLMKQVEVAGHRGAASLTIPGFCVGTIVLNASKFGADGNCVQAHRLLQIEPAEKLNVEASLDKASYRPGEQAKASFSVTGANGSPRQAALSVSALDKALLILRPPRELSPQAFFNFDAALLPADFQADAEDALFKGGDSLTARRLLGYGLGSPSLTTLSTQSYAERENKNIDNKRRLAQFLLLALALLGSATLLWMIVELIGLLRLKNGDPACLAAAHELLEKITSLVYAGVVLNAVMSLVVALSRDLMTLWMAFAFLTLSNFAFLAFWRFKARGKFAPECGAPLSTLKATTPWIFITNIAGSFLVILLAFFFNEPPLWQYLSFVLMSAGIVIAFLMQLLRRKLFGSLYSGVIVPSLGGGLGCKRMSFWYLAFIPFFSIAPLIYLFCALFLTVLALFMPLICITEKLGGGGGGGGGNWYPSGSWRGQGVWSNPESKGFHFKDATGALAENRAKTRSNFPETLLWRPEIVCDANGKAELSFDVADSIADYKLSAVAGDKAGALGSSTRELKVFQNFFIDFRAPLLATQNDMLSLPVSVYNYLDTAQSVVMKAEASSGIRFLGGEQRVSVAPRSMSKAFLPLKLDGKGLLKIRVVAKGDGCEDAIEKEIEVAPPGCKKERFAVNGAVGTGEIERSFAIPENAIDIGSATLKTYPSPLAELGEAVGAMVQMPHGCFEQTSSINYPNIMITRYLERQGLLTEERKAKCLECIQAGYQRLLSFRTGGGFSLWGKGSPNLALSAYGFMQLAEMDGLICVDPQVLEQTRSYIVSKLGQDARWGDLKLNAYIAYSLQRRPEMKWGLEIRQILSRIVEDAKSSEDPYALAIAANALMTQCPDDAKAILNRLRAKTIREADGSCHWNTSSPGVFCSYGQSTDIETTALSICAINELEYDDGSIIDAIRWLHSKRYPCGLWGSTQSSVQAMRALMSVPSWNGKSKLIAKDAHLQAELNGIRKDLLLKTDDFDITRFIDFGAALKRGKNEFKVSSDAQRPVSWQLIYDCYLPQAKPQESRQEIRPKLDFLVDYKPLNAKLGDVVKCKVHIKNASRAPMPMGMACIGTPAGLETIAASIEKLKADGVVSDASVEPGKVVLYFQDFASEKPINFEFALLAVHPASATTPPSTAYPYYQQELEVECAPAILTITPK